MAADSPSSQPTSPAPNASSVKGRRAEAFETLLNGALNHTMSKVSYENFAACFPTWAAYKPKSLKEFHGQFVQRLRSTCETNFEDIMEQRKVIALLNSLDSLIAQAITRKEEAEAVASTAGVPIAVPTPPHRLPPTALLTSTMQPFLATEQASMQTRLAAVEARNVALADTIKHQKVEADAAMSRLEAVIRDLECAGQLAQGGGEGEAAEQQPQQEQDISGLSRETRTIEEALRQAG